MSDDARILVHAKQMFLHGVRHAQSNARVDRIIAIHDIHNSVEWVLGLVAEKHQVDPNLNFQPLLKEVSKRIKGIPRRELERIANARNSAQHRGIPPDPEALAHYRMQAESFMRIIIEGEFVPLTWDGLSLADLIPDDMVIYLPYRLDYFDLNLEAGALGDSGQLYFLGMDGKTIVTASLEYRRRDYPDDLIWLEFLTQEDYESLRGRLPSGIELVLHVDPSSDRKHYGEDAFGIGMISLDDISSEDQELAITAVSELFPTYRYRIYQNAQEVVIGDEFRLAEQLAETGKSQLAIRQLHKTINYVREFALLRLLDRMAPSVWTLDWIQREFEQYAIQNKRDELVGRFFQAASETVKQLILPPNLINSKDFGVLADLRFDSHLNKPFVHIDEKENRVDWSAQEMDEYYRDRTRWAMSFVFESIEAVLNFIPETLD